MQPEEQFQLMGESVPSPVFVDRLFQMEATGTEAFRVGARNGHKWCHMWTSPGNEAELHRIASAIGMRRAWFQDKPGFPHYDLVPGRRVAAVKLGVVERDLRDWIRERRAAAAQTSPISHV